MKENRFYVALFSAVGLIIVAVLLIALCFCGDNKPQTDANSKTWKIAN